MGYVMMDLMNLLMIIVILHYVYFMSLTKYSYQYLSMFLYTILLYYTYLLIINY